MSVRKVGLRARRLSRVCSLLAVVALMFSWSPTARAHVFVSVDHRAGAYPPIDGDGWIASVYLDIPNFDLAHLADLSKCMEGPGVPLAAGCRRADIDGDGDGDLRDVWRLERDFLRASLLHAERYAEGQPPDFTFKTDWIDFPAGPQHSDLDANFLTMGDFFNDYVREISDPAMLDEPFGSFFVRFSGFVKVRMEDEERIRDFIDLPVWVDFGTMGYDGYRTRVGESVYSIANVNWNGQPFFNFGPSIEVPGLYPIEVTFFNSHDPTGELGYERAGIEEYSWHGGGLPWPSGQQMIHPIKGPGTLVPPRIIYQALDLRPVVLGDFNADTHVDLRDFWWFQFCFDPNIFFLPFGCNQIDFDQDGAVEAEDLVNFNKKFFGPGIPAFENAPP